MKKLPEQLLEFVPVSDEQLYQNPLLLFKLIPYSRKYRCLRQRAALAEARTVALPEMSNQVQGSSIDQTSR